MSLQSQPSHPVYLEGYEVFECLQVVIPGSDVDWCLPLKVQSVWASFAVEENSEMSSEMKFSPARP